MILAEIVIMYLIYQILKLITLKIFKTIDKLLIEKMVLTSLVIYWLIGNSSGNILFLLGFRISTIWTNTTFAAIPVTLIYVLTTLYFVNKNAK